MNIYPRNNVIYRISNSVNNKIYIGQSKHHKQRWTEHKYSANTGSKMEIHRAMIRYGIDKFTFEPLLTVLNECDLDWAEKELIKQWDCCYLDGWEKGYNGTRGGDGISSEQRSAIQKSLVEKGNHIFLGSSGNFKMLQDGVHPSQEIRICPYCNENGRAPAIFAHHFENCKSNPDYVEHAPYRSEMWEVMHIDWKEWKIVENMANFIREHAEYDLKFPSISRNAKRRLSGIDEWHKNFKFRKLSGPVEQC